MVKKEPGIKELAIASAIGGTVFGIGLFCIEYAKLVSKPKPLKGGESK